MTDILTCVRSWLIVVLICFTNTKGFFFFNRGTCWLFTWEYCPFSNWIFIAIKLFDSLYILGINPHQMYNWLVFSLHLQNDLFMLSTASFVEEKLFSSAQSHLSVFCAFGVISKETCLN